MLHRRLNRRQHVLHNVRQRLARPRHLGFEGRLERVARPPPGFFFRKKAAPGDLERGGGSATFSCLDVEAVAPGEEEVGAPQRLADLLAPVLALGQVDRDRLLLPLEEGLADRLGQGRKDSVVRQEEVVRVAQLSLCLVALVLCLELGEADDLQRRARTLGCRETG